MVHTADIISARVRLNGYLRPTPLEAMPNLGNNIWLKLENTNRTHSFKARGALNAMLSLAPDARLRGVVTVSSGNHAQGVAYAAHLAQVKAKILMPTHTPRRKVDGARQYGSDVILFGDNYDETEMEGRRIAREEDLAFISPYNDPQVIAGAGTIGLELLDDLPAIRRVIVPAGGGGLICGIGTALKAQDPSIEVIGVCAVSTPALYNFIHHATYPQIWDTLAEALSGEIEADSITFEIARRVVDRVVLVSEEAIAAAMCWLAYQSGWIVEGGGAVGVAALQSGIIPEDGKPTAIIISGGNVDENSLRQILSAKPIKSG